MSPPKKKPRTISDFFSKPSTSSQSANVSTSEFTSNEPAKND